MAKKKMSEEEKARIQTLYVDWEPDQFIKLLVEDARIISGPVLKKPAGGSYYGVVSFKVKPDLVTMDYLNKMFKNGGVIDMQLGYTEPDRTEEDPSQQTLPIEAEE